ncbi:hypothetical protein EJ04DRAFT_530134 [Polyplosphaeria fusca]|uniref:Uncharacterized protein n=1 Tax=Polyplosphaeria fusca TaxID=682080 RepID=A0A9P4UV87_9PLEO|nr:hypothetical protein EJ04DRAFT_530134 [Polyplosphaeria fusca]
MNPPTPSSTVAFSSSLCPPSSPLQPRPIHQHKPEPQLQRQLQPENWTRLQQEDADMLARFTTYTAAPHFLLTCNSCHVVLPLNRVENHFSNKIHNYSKPDCRRLLAAYTAVYLPTRPLLVRNEQELQNWTPTAQESLLVPTLPIYYAVHCTYNLPDGSRCPKIIMDDGKRQRNMRDHCRKVHHWQCTTKRGGQSQLDRMRRKQGREGEEMPWERGVPCQRLTDTGVGKAPQPALAKEAPQPASATEPP